MTADPARPERAPPLHTYEVQADAQGERLDKFLVGVQAELGRQGARWLTEQGLVRVDGARASKSRRLRAGERVEVFGEWGGAPPAEPDAKLVLVLERPDLVVVDKPAGQASAPLGAVTSGTLAGALLGRYPEMRALGYRSREPGLLHRLDTSTSGLVLAARTQQAFDTLREALAQERLHKRYLAIVADERLPDTALLEQLLAPHASGSGRVVVASSEQVSGARFCRSRVRTIERHGRWALVEVEASRAYRHQVRVQLAAAGWPIAGDREYGGSVAAALEDRHALHASHLGWNGDEAVPPFVADSLLPSDLRAFLERG